LIVLVARRDPRREAFEVALRRAGFDVRSTDQAAQCLPIVRCQVPDLIAIERALADGDGWDLVPTLRRLSWTTRTPVLALALGTSDADVARALTRGCDACSTTSAGLDALIVRVRSLVASASRAAVRHGAPAG
jgi:DNA-binding response OmpR family regulator